MHHKIHLRYDTQRHIAEYITANFYCTKLENYLMTYNEIVTNDFLPNKRNIACHWPSSPMVEFLPRSAGGQGVQTQLSPRTKKKKKEILG